MLKKLAYRVYQNLLMGDRLAEYHSLLAGLAKQGYHFLTVADLATHIKANNLPELSCIVRMDVDSDVATARQMAELADTHGVRATYYFRLSTLDQHLMRWIASTGSEIGYHYEELAASAKRQGLRNKAQIDACLPEIRADFTRNIATYAEHAGQWPVTVASHGDWINRRLHIANHYALNRELLEQFGIVAEAYDAWLNAPVKMRFSDTDAPEWWKPCAPAEAISERVPCLYFLVHPRQWQARVRENIALEMLRLVEASRYALVCRMASQAASDQSTAKC